MYIISKHKDYYDGVVGSVGLDKTIVYDRNIKEITENTKIPKEFQYKKFSWNESNSFINICGMNIDNKKTQKYEDVNGFILGFCGKLYLGWKFFYKEKELDIESNCFNEVTKIDIIYGFNNAREFLKTEFWRRNTMEDDVKYVEKYNPIEIFREINAPIFIYEFNKPKNNIVFTINPILKNYEFYKVIDSFTAFQEIQMFMSGVLGTNEKEIIEIDDKHKITQHGFDYKWSFRKEPVKKRN